MKHSTQAPAHTWTTFTTHREVLDAAPFARDIPTQTRAGSRIVTRTILAAIAVGFCLAAPRVFHWIDAVTPLTVVAIVCVLLWGLAVLPPVRAFRFAQRWKRAYERLGTGAESVTGTIDELRLVPSPGDQIWAVSGIVRYEDQSKGTQRAQFGTERIFRVMLPTDQLPTEASPVVVWHTPDHDVVLVRIFAGTP